MTITKEINHGPDVTVITHIEKRGNRYVIFGVWVCEGNEIRQMNCPLGLNFACPEIAQEVAENYAADTVRGMLMGV